MAYGKLDIDAPKQFGAFDPDESYFSEDDENELAKDELKAYQKIMHEQRGQDGHFLERLEEKLNTNEVDRFERRARKMKLKSIGTKVGKKAFNAKEILKRIKRAGMIGNQLEIDVAAAELKNLEKQQADEAIEKSLKN